MGADTAFKAGGTNFKNRALASRLLLGFTGDDSVRYVQELQHPPSLPAAQDVGKGKYSIGGSVTDAQGKPVAGVLLRLQMILPQDTAYTEDSVINNYVKYLRTDANGAYRFQGLADDQSYSILPLKPALSLADRRAHRNWIKTPVSTLNKRHIQSDYSLQEILKY